MLEAKCEGPGDEVDDIDEDCRIYKNIRVGITEDLCARSAAMGVQYEPQEDRTDERLKTNTDWSGREIHTFFMYRVNSYCGKYTGERVWVSVVACRIRAGANARDQ